MAETVGLVAAIIEITRCSKAIYDRFKEIRTKTGEVPRAFREVERQLFFFTSAFQEIRKQAERKGFDEEVLEPLDLLLADCDEDVKAIATILDKVAPPEYPSTWTKVKIVAKTLKLESSFLESAERLKSHLQTLSNYQTILISSSVALLGRCKGSNGNQITSFQTVARRLVSKPRLLHDKIEELESTPSETEAPNLAPAWTPTMVISPVAEGYGIIWPPQRSLDFSQRKCSCKRHETQQSTSWKILGIVIESALINQHRRHCPRFVASRNENRTSLVIRIGSFLVGKALQLTLQMTSGAGGFGVSPALSLKGNYNPSSPIHHILAGVVNLFEEDSTSQKHNHCQNALIQIQKAIALGKMTPFETDKFGRAITADNFVSKSALTIQGVDPAAISFMNGLNILGFPMQEEEADDRGSFSYWVYRSSASEDMYERLGGFIRQAKSLLAAGADNLAIIAIRGVLDLVHFHDFGEKTYYFLPVFFQRRIPEFAEACNCNALQIGLLSQDDDRSSHSIAKYSHLVNETDDLGQTALHLVADWSSAVSLLLDNGAQASVRNYKGATALDYACSQGSVEAVRLLLERSSDFPWRTFARPFGSRYKSDNSSSAIKMLLVKHLIEGRRNLLHRCREVLRSDIKS